MHTGSSRGGGASTQAQAHAFPRLALSPLPVGIAPALKPTLALGSQSAEAPFIARPRLATMTGDFAASISAFSYQPPPPPPPPASKLEVRKEAATFAKPKPKRAAATQDELPPTTHTAAAKLVLQSSLDQENNPPKTHTAAARQYGKLRAGSHSRMPLQLRGVENAYEIMHATHAAAKASATAPFSSVRTAHRSLHRQSKATTALREQADNSDDDGPKQEAAGKEAEKEERPVEEAGNESEREQPTRVLRKPKKKIDYRLDAPGVLESFSDAYIDESTPVQSKRAGHKRKTRATPAVLMTTALKQAKDWATDLDRMAPSEFEVTAKKKKARHSNDS
jgi:hypothetical protein